MRESQTPRGRLTIIMRDPATGEVVLERHVHNLVTLAGRKLLAEILTGAAGVAQVHMAVGGPTQPDESPPPPHLSDTSLHNPLRVVRASAEAPVQQDEGPGHPRMFTRISGTLDAEIGGEKLVLTEAGIQIAKLDGTSTLYNRVVFDQITKEPNLQITLTWEVIF